MISMLKTPTVTKKFEINKEAGQNPYMGIMSFQHFRGESLYSDITVKPENNYCETENLECYPIPEYVPQNGRNEGYYPDSTVAYIRVLWKEFEPEREVYNYRFIQDIIDKARAHSQTLIFRLMPHSTRACDDVPDWVRKLVFCPERPMGMRVKESPTDPRFVELFCRAIKKIGEKFDSDPVFDTIDISLPGAWGEGHDLELYRREDIIKIFDTYTESFKHTQLVSQYHRTEFLKYVAKKRSIGWRADGLGEPRHTAEYYPPAIAEISDFWKTAPVSFEAYWWLGEWKRQGWDIDEIIEKTLEWHISSFNPKSVPIPFEWREKTEYWLSKMGYHFAIDAFSYPEKAVSGDEIQLRLEIDNIGVAPSYHSVPLYIKLEGTEEYIFKTEIDIRKWMPGKHCEDIKIKLPKDLKAGNYDIKTAVYDDVAKTVYFATDAEFDGKFYTTGRICIESGNS